MFQSLSKIWWLLALCGIADAVIAVLNLLMLDLNASRNTVWDMSILALAAGACAIAAGVKNSGRGNSWMLSLHGFALATFGLFGISPIVRGPLSFRPISLLFALMAASLGAFAWVAARTPHAARTDRWLLMVAGVASMIFAFSFIAVGFGWIRFAAPDTYWIWMSSYFTLCAIFMLYLALRARSHGAIPLGPREIPPTATTPRHAH